MKIMSIVALQPTQVKDLVNNATKQTLGEDAALVNEDLQGLVDIGTSLANANAYKNWLHNLQIAQAELIFAWRPYKKKEISILKKNFEWGLLTSVVKQKLPKAIENQSFKLTNNTSYDDNVFVNRDVIVKIYKEQATFDLQVSIAEEQIKTAFTDANQMNTFISQTFGLVSNAVDLFMENLTNLTINNMIGETFVNDTGNDEGVRVKYLLKDYKTYINPNSTITSDNCLFDKEFLRYAGAQIKKYMKRLEKYNTKYNIEHLEEFTPRDAQHVYLLDEFVSNCETYLDSDTFHDELVKLPYYESTPYFQAIGDESIKDSSSIKITTASGNTIDKHYILGTIFDHEALGMRQNKPSARSHEVASAEFVNHWFKNLFSYYNNLSYQMIVFSFEDVE